MGPNCACCCECEAAGEYIVKECKINIDGIATVVNTKAQGMDNNNAILIP